LKGISLKAGSRDVRIAGNRFEGNGRGRSGKDQVRVAGDSRAIRIETDNIFE
jgi:nitrous oxidase accessory protein NosD